MKLFERFKINTDFLNIETSNWENDKTLKKVSAQIKNIPIVNDITKRGQTYLKI